MEPWTDKFNQECDHLQGTLEGNQFQQEKENRFFQTVARLIKFNTEIIVLMWRNIYDIPAATSGKPYSWPVISLEYHHQRKGLKTQCIFSQ
jgi:hypothetical protein